MGNAYFIGRIRITRVSRGLIAGLLTIAVVNSVMDLHAQETARILAEDRPRISGPLSLEAAVDLAVSGNPTVSAMEAEAEAARQDTRATRAMTRPQLSATTYLSTGTAPGILGTTPGVLPANALIVPDRTFADQNLTLMIPLYTGGRLKSAVQAASQRENVAQADIGAAQADAAYRVKEIYSRALLAGEMLKVATARVDASTALVEVTRAQFEAGKGIQASVARATAELADARRMLANSRNDQMKTLLDLRRAMGVRLDSDVTLSDTLSTTALEADLDANLTEAARLRPELLAARARLDAAKAETHAAGGARKPQIYGAAMADAFAPRNGAKSGGATVGVIMSFPLLDGGQRGAEVSRMQALERRSEFELKDIELRVATEVRQARLDVDTANENHHAALAALESSQTAYDVMVVRVENQKSILVEQLDALAALTQARANVAQALFDHSIAMARLDRAIGRR